MKEILSNRKIRGGLLIAAAVLVAAILLIVFMGKDSSETTAPETYEHEVITAEMQKTLTAAGEVTYAESENIYFSTSKTFRTMCVEEGELVSEGQNLISYTDGTYETAPSNGVIVSINAPSTGSVASTNNLIAFGDTDTLSLEITVPEDQINEISEGDKASIVVNAYTSKTYKGTIVGLREMSTTLISEKASSASVAAGFGGQSGMSSGGSDPFGSESSTAYYTVVLEFKNDGTLRPGMSANSTVTIEDRTDVLVVPVEAVYFDEDDNPYVMLIKSGKSSKQEVKIGESDAANVEILKGLSEGDTIEVEKQK